MLNVDLESAPKKKKKGSPLNLPQNASAGGKYHEDILSFKIMIGLYLGNSPKRRLHQGVVRHEDLPYAQHLHHYGVVLEEDHHDVSTPRASGKVRADFGALLRMLASSDLPAMDLLLSLFKWSVCSLSWWWFDQESSWTPFFFFPLQLSHAHSYEILKVPLLSHFRLSVLSLPFSFMLWIIYFSLLQGMNCLASNQSQPRLPPEGWCSCRHIPFLFHIVDVFLSAGLYTLPSLIRSQNPLYFPLKPPYHFSAPLYNNNNKKLLTGSPMTCTLQRQCSFLNPLFS